MSIKYWLIVPEMVMMLQLTLNVALKTWFNAAAIIAYMMIIVYLSVSPFFTTKLLILCSVPLGLYFKMEIRAFNDGRYPFGLPILLSILVSCELVAILIIIPIYRNMVQQTQLHCQGCQQLVFSIKHDIALEVIQRDCGLWHPGCPGNKCAALICFCGSRVEGCSSTMNECQDCMKKCSKHCQRRIILEEHQDYQQRGNTYCHLGKCSSVCLNPRPRAMS